MLGDAMNILKKYDSKSSILKDGLLSKLLTYSKPDITYFFYYIVYLKKTHLLKRKDKHNYSYNFPLAEIL